MSKYILSEEFKRMQQLAGITEIKVNEPTPRDKFVLKIHHYDPSSYKLIGVETKFYPSEEKAQKAAVAHNWGIAWDNGDTDLSEDEYVNTYSFNDLDHISYDNYMYEIEPIKK